MVDHRRTRRPRTGGLGHIRHATALMLGVSNVGQIWKAIVAGATAAATWLATSFADGELTAAEWAILPAGVIVAVGAVFGVRNQPLASTPTAPTTQERAK